MLFRLIALCLACLACLALFSSSVSALPLPIIGTTAGVYDTLSRVLLLDARSAFSVSLDPSAKCASISSGNSALNVIASSAVDAVAVVAQYARETFNASFSWENTGGSSLGSLPRNGDPLPMPNGGSRKLCRVVNYTYYQNVVQSSYSNVWWNVTRWQNEIDWMALHGINVALAYGGQEALFRTVYLSLGLTDEELGAFFNGPAFLSWSRGQGMAGVGGPLPQWWYDSQLKLNQQIIQMMTAVGIQPILPVFQGNVPVELSALFPQANISSNGWLDVFDPLFTTIQDNYFIQLQNAYPITNTNASLHWYEADGLFMAGTPPWRDGGSIGGADANLIYSVQPDPNALARSKAAYTSFSKHDNQAVWVYQSWIWRGFSSEADLAYATGWLQGAPPGNLFLLDQTAERIPIWQKFKNFSFNGQPFAWLSMNNMGGNVGLTGAFQWVSDGIAGALQSSNGALSGIGMDPEGINTMPSYWEYVLAMAWGQGSGGTVGISASDFLADYGVRRCGKEVPGVREAYSLLADTVFSPNQPNDEHHLIYCGTAMPLQGAGNSWDKESGMIRAAWYTSDKLAQTWSLLNEAAPSCDAPLLYDLVDVAREYLSVFPCVAAHDSLNAATTLTALASANNSIVEVLSDLDTLLGSTSGFLTGAWINDARELGLNNGGSSADLALLEWNTRSQISTWYPSPPDPGNHLYDYANKMWNGITRDYYLQRYVLLANRIETAIKAGTKVDANAYLADLGILGDSFTRATGANYSITPVGDAHLLSVFLYQKYVQAA